MEPLTQTWTASAEGARPERPRKSQTWTWTWTPSVERREPEPSARGLDHPDSLL